MRYLGLIGILLFTVSCGLTSQGDAFRASIREKGKAVAATSLENSEWYMCRAASVGSIKDRYGISSDKVIAYNIICTTDPKFSPILSIPKSEEKEEPTLEATTL